MWELASSRKVSYGEGESKERVARSSFAMAARNPSPLRRFSVPVARVVALGFALSLSACKPNYIPNTDVEDNSFNRKVVEFCENYRKAVERKNVGQLLSLADESYYEDGGNIDASDDIDYAGLREFLETKFRDTKGIRYEIRYRKVEQTKEKKIFVDYTFSASYKLPTENGDQWKREVADNRLELVPFEDGYRIVAGM